VQHATPCGGFAFGDGTGRVVEEISVGSDIALSLTADANYFYPAGYDAAPGTLDGEWRASNAGC
jgi:hypothetical protein